MPTYSNLLIKVILIILSITFVTIFIYNDALYGDFLSWDTDRYVTDNTHIRNLGWESLQWMLTTYHASNWHPLTWFSHAIDYSLFGLEPQGHHFSSILLHCLNAILLFILAIVLLRIVRFSTPSSTNFDNKILAAASIASLLFAIHPLHVESVAWIAERKNLLCQFFSLLTLLSYLSYTKVTQHTRIHWYILTLICFLFALMSKPMAITIPIILLLIDVYPLQRIHPLSTIKRFRGKFSKQVDVQSKEMPHFKKTVILEKLPFFALSAFSVFITIAAQSSGEAIVSLDTLSLFQRLLNALNSILFYLSKFLFPIGLSPFYPLDPNVGIIPWDYYYSSSIIIILPIVITLLCGYLWFKGKYYWFITWLFYLITLSPVIGIIQVGSQAAADRYTYFPTLPFYIIIGGGIVYLYGYICVKFQRVAKVSLIAVLLGIFVTFSYLTRIQTHLWKDDLSLWKFSVIYNPNSAVAQFNLASAYYKIGNYEMAIAHLSFTLSINSISSEAYFFLAVIYIQIGRLREATEILEYLIKHRNIIYQGEQIREINNQRSSLHHLQKVLATVPALTPEDEQARKSLPSFIEELQKVLNERNNKK